MTYHCDLICISLMSSAVYISMRIFAIHIPPLRAFTHIGHGGFGDLTVGATNQVSKWAENCLGGKFILFLT